MPHLDGSERVGEYMDLDKRIQSTDSLQGIILQQNLLQVFFYTSRSSWDELTVKFKVVTSSRKIFLHDCIAIPYPPIAQYTRVRANVKYLLDCRGPIFDPAKFPAPEGWQFC